MATQPYLTIDGIDFYWFAVRESWPLHGERKLKILSRRAPTKKDAEDIAEYTKSLLKRPNRYHKYHAILMPDPS